MLAMQREKPDEGESEGKHPWNRKFLPEQRLRQLNRKQDYGRDQKDRVMVARIDHDDVRKRRHTDDQEEGAGRAQWTQVLAEPRPETDSQDKRQEEDGPAVAEIGENVAEKQARLGACEIADAGSYMCRIVRGVSV